jgi:hypothetical protein
MSAHYPTLIASAKVEDIDKLIFFQLSWKHDAEFAEQLHEKQMAEL